MRQSTLTSIKLLLTTKELAYKNISTRAESGSCLAGGHKTDAGWDTRFQMPEKQSVLGPRSGMGGTGAPGAGIVCP